MIRGNFSLAVLLLAHTCVQAHGQELRIELFSKSAPTSLTVHAGAEPVRICEAARGQSCLAVEPQAVAHCNSIASTFRCRSGEKAKEFRSATLFSPIPFRLVAGLGKSTPSDPPASAMLRKVDAVHAKGGLRLIATMDLETYVRGVLAGEAATLKSPEALAAMAVVARTWALRARGRHRADGFDFCPLTHCQFFRPPAEPGDSQSPVLAEAVTKTAGVVLKFHGQLIDAYYGAHCGGMTEAAGDVWRDRSAPYLRSVSDPYCARGEQATWQQAVSLVDLGNVLHGMTEVAFRGQLRDLAIENKDASGRARMLRIAGNSIVWVDANTFRYAVNRQLGWNTLKSNLYTVERRGDVLVFIGRGLGHGVGLCQAGAEQMGQMGISFDKILAHYFPGAILDGSGVDHAERILSSEHFEMVFPPRQERLAAKALEALEAQRAKLAGRAEALPTRIRVRTWETTDDFIRATRQPGWVAASNDGRVIDLQPLDLLKRKGVLESTLRHELTHLVVRRRRAPEVPRWYEEGLVLYLTGEPVGETTRSLDPRRSLELSLSEPRSENEMRVAYARALDRVKEFAQQRGEAALWQVLERPSREDLRWFKNVK